MHEAPLVLTIHLKRFSPMGRKISHPVRYEERVSLGPLMSEGHFGPSYSLYGVISHAGGGPNSGHYYAHVKGANGQWYEMNDECVTRQSGAPTGLKNAYMLFYIREKGQALEAALSVPSASPVRLPVRTGIVANMKKRKIVESDDEDSTSPAKRKGFIGPLLPTASSPSPAKEPAKTDPQAAMLKKKIAAATAPKPKNALASLAAYTDGSSEDDNEDVGEKVSPAEGKKDGTPPPKSPSPSSTAPTAPDAAPRSPTSPAAAPPARGSSPSAIPPSSFYGAPAPKPKDRKRKSPDGEEDEGSTSMAEYARTPLPTPRTPNTPRFSAGSPFNRLKGGNNLQQRRESGPIVRYGHGRRKRTFMM